MPHFSSDGVQIAYAVAGEGDPILLIHGFASNSEINWGSTGWIKMLVEAGRQVITIDNRGHGGSEKLYDPAAYEAPEMAEDSRRLLDHLAIENADVMGYSMGARITTFLAINRPERVRRAVVAGMAGNMFKGVETSEAISDALLADNIDEIDLPAAKAFRLFADRTGGDRRALAACMRAGRPALSHDVLATISCPVLVVAGDEDTIAGPVDPLVEAIPGAAGLPLPGRDHMKAVGDMTYKRGAIAFLNSGH